MTKNITFYIFILATVLYSCNHRGEDTLHRAEKLLATNPDSAIIVLNRAAPTVGSYSRHNQMLYLLLRTEALNKTFARLDTVSYINRVLDYFNRHGNKTERIRANYIAGCVCRDKGNSPLALQYYNDAVNLADTTRADCDFALLSRIYGQMAEIFEKQRYPQKELEMLNKVAHYALKTRDTLMYIDNTVSIACVYHMMGDRNSFFQITQKAYNEYKRIGNDERAASLLGVMADHYIWKNDMKMAKHAIDEYKNKSGMFDEHGEVKQECEIFYYYEGQYYEGIEKNDSAEYCYRKLLNFRNDISNIENGYKGLLSVYLRLHQPDSVSKYANLYAAANDSANFKNSADEISRTQALYDYSENQRKASEKEAEAIRLRFIIYVTTFSVLALLISVCIYIKRVRKENLKKTKEVNRKYTELLMEFETCKDELDALQANSKKYEVDKLLELDRLSKQIATYHGNDTVEEKSALEHNLLNQQIVKDIHNYATKGMMPSDSEWISLISTAKNMLPKFYTDITTNGNATLSDKEIKVCILTKLNFIPLEIACLLNLTKQRITNMRGKINMKLFKESGAKSFDKNIHSL